MDLFRLDGKTVAITGASSGFGHHFAGLLAAAGANVVLGARRRDKLEARVAEINALQGGRAVATDLDVLDTASLKAFLATAQSAFGRIDVLVNNAGIEAGAKTFTMIDEDDWDQVLNTNLRAAWLLSKLYCEHVVATRQGHGNIINIASITAYRTIKGQFPYTVSKAALVKATEVMALEAAKLGIRVNALAPGYILTDVSRVLIESERGPQFMKSIPMRRYGEMDDLDGPMLLLASDASKFMTGSTVVVDGGHICAELG
jgi:NAD(P)-dependent dehydrogenase (short-subunit alcohol dehydrogenase family)